MCRCSKVEIDKTNAKDHFNTQDHLQWFDHHNWDYGNALFSQDDDPKTPEKFMDKYAHTTLILGLRYNNEQSSVQPGME